MSKKHSEAPTQQLELERLSSVVARTGLSRSEIYRRIKEGSFCRQVRIGRRAVAFDRRDIDAFIQSAIDESKKGGS